MGCSLLKLQLNCQLVSKSLGVIIKRPVTKVAPTTIEQIDVALCTLSDDLVTYEGLSLDILHLREGISEHLCVSVQLILTFEVSQVGESCRDSKVFCFLLFSKKQPCNQYLERTSMKSSSGKT
jgi:hypothetical protein